MGRGERCICDLLPSASSPRFAPAVPSHSRLLPTPVYAYPHLLERDAGRQSELARFDTQAHTPLTRLEAARVTTSERATGAMMESSNTASGRSWRNSAVTCKRSRVCPLARSYLRRKIQRALAIGGRRIRRAPGDEEDLRSPAHRAVLARPPSPTLSAYNQQRLRMSNELPKAPRRAWAWREEGEGPNEERRAGHEPDASEACGTWNAFGKEDVEQRQALRIASAEEEGRSVAVPPRGTAEVWHHLLLSVYIAQDIVHIGEATPVIEWQKGALARTADAIPRRVKVLGRASNRRRIVRILPRTFVAHVPEMRFRHSIPVETEPAQRQNLGNLRPFPAKKPLE
ncbi:hypothetical protein B0H17DRAFT_1185819 [Mycena rosella]|uniref:Uncharacterized protein n=1 Tax=Mycena rosella TaxID=1033263 RepID=A0AAD7CPS5_MYCRO|nr:hypothetical protein B0H17DRAFT_1185819 [Mycena rosella]